jgi:hypothetical protein
LQTGWTFLHKEIAKIVNQYALLVVGDVRASKLAKTRLVCLLRVKKRSYSFQMRCQAAVALSKDPAAELEQRGCGQLCLFGATPHDEVHGHSHVDWLFNHRGALNLLALTEIKDAARGILGRHPRPMSRRGEVATGFGGLRSKPPPRQVL